MSHHLRPHHHSSYYYLESDDDDVAAVAVLGEMAWYDSPVAAVDEILVSDQQTDSASSGWNQAMLWHLHFLHRMNDNMVQGEKRKTINLYGRVLKVVAAVTDQGETEGLVNDDDYYFVIGHGYHYLEGVTP